MLDVVCAKSIDSTISLYRVMGVYLRLYPLCYRVVGLQDKKSVPKYPNPFKHSEFEDLKSVFRNSLYIFILSKKRGSQTTS